MLRDLWQKLSPEMRFVNALENDELKLGIHTAVPVPETLQHVVKVATQLSGGSKGKGGGNPTCPLPQSSHGIHCGQLILRKICKIDATSQILRLKCTEFDFRWG